MPSVWEQRHAEFVRRVLALREGTALEALPDLMPVLPVVDPASQELLLPRRERPYAAQGQQAAAGAGNFSEVRLTNPTRTGGSGLTILCVDRVWFSAVTTATIVGITTQQANASGTGAQVYQTLDTRGSPPPFGLSSARSNAEIVQRFTNALNSNYHARYWASPSETREFPLRFVLTPGSSICVQCETDNIGLIAGFTFRERQVDVAEMNPTGA